MTRPALGKLVRVIFLPYCMAWRFQGMFGTLRRLFCVILRIENVI